MEVKTMIRAEIQNKCCYMGCYDAGDDYKVTMYADTEDEMVEKLAHIQANMNTDGISISKVKVILENGLIYIPDILVSEQYFEQFQEFSRDEECTLINKAYNSDAYKEAKRVKLEYDKAEQERKHKEYLEQKEEEERKQYEKLKQKFENTTK
jgi:hypothetical protein